MDILPSVSHPAARALIEAAGQPVSRPLSRQVAARVRPPDRLSADVGRALRLPAVRNRLNERILPEADLHRILSLEPDPRNRAILTLLTLTQHSCNQGQPVRDLQQQKRRVCVPQYPTAFRKIVRRYEITPLCCGSSGRKHHTAAVYFAFRQFCEIRHPVL